MPPELLIHGDLSKACDVYAFGALLWELFCGERPWANMLPMQVVPGPVPGNRESMNMRQVVVSYCILESYQSLSLENC